VVHISNDRSKRRAEARRIEILRAAARIFRRRGFAAAGMREIGEAADLSSGNLYHYFSGKDEILYFCQDRSLDRLLAALETAVSMRQPLPERLRSLAERHVLCLIAEVEGSAAHFEVDALPEKRRRAIVAKRDRYERGVRRLVAAGIRRGTVRVSDATVATRAFLGALNWTAQWFRPDGDRSAEDVAAIVADFAVSGLISIPSPQPKTGHDQNDDSTLRERRTVRRRVRAVQDAARGVA
jgi:AcrR family transcriptional regulator